jgi:hypothetical protein
MAPSFPVRWAGSGPAQEIALPSSHAQTDDRCQFFVNFDSLGDHYRTDLFGEPDLGNGVPIQFDDLGTNVPDLSDRGEERNTYETATPRPWRPWRHGDAKGPCRFQQRPFGQALISCYCFSSIVMVQLPKFAAVTSR